jgi:hypothetical protein
MLHHGHRSIGRVLLIATVVTASVVLAGGEASAGRPDPPGHTDANHCVNRFDVDYNLLYGVSDQFRTFECRVVSAGERWVPLMTWITNDINLVYPQGYVPSLPAPSDDFLAKLVEVKVVVDGGTSLERTYLFDPSDIVRTDINAEDVNPGAWGRAYPMASILPIMPPEVVGDHTFEPFLVLSAEHCDGFGTDPELQCLPAGEVSFGLRPLSITPPEH